MSGTTDNLGELNEQAALWADLFIADELSAAGAAELEEWLRADPRHRVAYEGTLQMLRSHTLRRALARAESSMQRPAFPRRLVGGGIALAGLAACVMAVLVLQPRISAPAPIPRLAAAEVWEIAYATQPGEAASHGLPDGSVFEMNGGTQLDVLFTDVLRRVELVKGDAAFRVAGDARRPFTVVAPQFSVTALGTAFTVTAFDGRSSVRVQQHSVRVDGKYGETVVIGEGQGAEIDDTGRMRVTSSESADDWRLGWVDTPGMRLGDLAAMVERQTGDSIRLSEGIGDLTVSGRFRIDDAQALARRVAIVHDLRVGTDRAGDIELLRTDR